MDFVVKVLVMIALILGYFFIVDYSEKSRKKD